MRFSKNGHRNRTMFVSFLSGISVSELASRHGLSMKRVQAILLSERHKREVSPAAAYQKLRAMTGFGVRYGVLLD